MAAFEIFYTMFYTKLLVVCDADLAEILIAETSAIGFDTFMENENGFEAYVENEQYDSEALKEIMERYQKQHSIAFSFETIPKKNWNAEWEKNYEPIIVEDQCIIRAHFHQPEKTYPYDIIITPKMSFGTGHHETTYMMIQNQLTLDHQGKHVMDAGCGTAILAIMAAKLGAREVAAFDIDEWSVLNGQENIDVNDTTNVSIQQGKISELTFATPFDIVLANINKNILLEEMHRYKSHLAPGGLLLMSGFYEEDIDDLLKVAHDLGLKEQKRTTRARWASLLVG